MKVEVEATKWVYESITREREREYAYRQIVSYKKVDIEKKKRG